MKRLLTVLSATLALNFLLAVGGIAYLYKTGKLDDAKIKTIRELVMHPATQPVATTQPIERDPTTQPTLALENMLSKVVGRPAGEQVEFMQRTFDSQMAILDRREQNLKSIQNGIDTDLKKLKEARDLLEADRTKFTAAQAQQNKALTEQGFQDTLNLYITMPSKQVKTIFMTMDDDLMTQYLRAMEPRTAAKIVKEFKAGEEVGKITRVMDKMRQPAPTTAPAPAQASIK